MQSIRRNIWVVLWVFAAAVPQLLAINDGSSTQLTCERQNDHSILCQFRIDAAVSEDAERSTDIRLENCPEEDDYCVHAAVSMRHQKRQPTEDDLSTEAGTSKMSAPVTADSAGLDEAASKNAIELDFPVGIATYRHPWSQYGPDVASVLAKQPISSSSLNSGNSFENTVNEDLLSLANWYYELGSAHFIRHQSSLVTDADWYEMELALNAFQQAAILLTNQDSSSEVSEQTSLLLQSMTKSSSAQSPRSIVLQQSELKRLYRRDSLLALVHFQMGEVYLTHPKGIYKENALICYQKAEALYTFMTKAFRTTSTLFLLHPSDRMEIRLRWADTCIRIGTILVAQLIVDPTVILMASKSAEAGFTKPTVYNLDADDLLPRFGGHPSRAEEVESLLDGTIEVYRSHCKMVDDGTSIGVTRDRNQSQASLATALQSAASLANLRGELDKSASLLLEARRIHVDILLPLYPAGSIKAKNCKISVSNILKSLANTFLQLGKYDESKQYYKQTMDWHDQYNIPVPSVRSVESLDPLSNEAGGLDAIIESYLVTLRNYHSMAGGRTDVENDHGNVGRDSGNSYQRDDRYEGDLHSTLGALFLSRDKADKARGHLENAVALYESHHGSKRKQNSDDLTLADAKYNLAIALSRLRDFSESVKIHFEALDIYEELYGPGLNPLVQRLEADEKALADILGKGGNLASNVDGDQHVDSENGEGGKTNQRLIDIEKYKQMVANATAMLTQGATQGDEL